MLVLSRKRNESLLVKIGDTWVEIEILKIETNKVRVGIRGARDEVAVMRSELLAPDKVSEIKKKFLE